MGYINEYKTMLDEADDCIAKGKEFSHIKLELWETYFLAAIADELHTLNITMKDIRNELKKRK